VSVSKFKSQQPQGNSANNVASLDAARRARQQAESLAVSEAAARNVRKMLAEQVFMPFPEDSPLGRAVDGAPSSPFPRAIPDSIEPLTIDTKVKPQVPQGKADE